jgi:hypothetical protein
MKSFRRYEPDQVPTVFLSSLPLPWTHSRKESPMALTANTGLMQLLSKGTLIG